MKHFLWSLKLVLILFVILILMKTGKHFHAQDLSAKCQFLQKGFGYDCEIISQAFTLCHQLKLPSAALTERQQQQHYAWALIAREVCVTDSLFLFTESIACAQTLVTKEERPVPQVQFHYKKDIFILFRLVPCNLIWPFRRYLRNKQ